MEFGQTNWVEWIESGRWLQVREIVLPVSPGLIDQAMGLAADPEVSVHHLVRLISKEQVLATRVLRLANSASNAPVRPITTITDATVRVGTNAVRNVLLAACVASKVEAEAVYMRGGMQLLDHAIGTAYMAELIASRADVDPNEALVCGLLHDIGKLAIVKMSIDAPGYRGPAPTHNQIERVVIERHALVGAQLLRAWRLPDRLREPVLYHHRPDLSVLFSELTLVVYVANRLSHRYGFGCEPDQEDDFLSDPWVAELGLDEGWLAEVDRRAPERFAAARALVA
jgi:putative nucleotidyltransferase with HDIG domain